MKVVNQYCTIYLVRHGQTEWNVKKLIHGHADSPLTALGKGQAAELASELKNIRFSVIFSSDLLRAKRTAEIIALEHKLAVETKKALRERNYGQLEGKPVEEIKLLEELQEKADEYLYRSHKIESDSKMIARLITFLREISVAYAGEIVLMVTHGGLMRALLVHLGFGTNEELRGGSIDNTAFIKLESDGVDFFIKETKGVNKLPIE